jgi:hypothetical protein
MVDGFWEPVEIRYGVDSLDLVFAQNNRLPQCGGGRHSLFFLLKTMVSGLVSSLLSSVSTLVQLVVRRPARVEGLQRLERLLRRIQATLDDAGEREVHDSSAKLWIEELTELARDAENVLDDCRYMLLWRRVHERQGAASSTSRKRKHEKDDDESSMNQVIQVFPRFL